MLLFPWLVTTFINCEQISYLSNTSPWTEGPNIEWQRIRKAGWADRGEWSAFDERVSDNDKTIWYGKRQLSNIAGCNIISNEHNVHVFLYFLVHVLEIGLNIVSPFFMKINLQECLVIKVSNKISNKLKWYRIGFSDMMFASMDD